MSAKYPGMCRMEFIYTSAPPKIRKYAVALCRDIRRLYFCAGCRKDGAERIYTRRSTIVSLAKVLVELRSFNVRTKRIVVLAGYPFSDWNGCYDSHHCIRLWIAAHGVSTKWWISAMLCRMPKFIRDSEQWMESVTRMLSSWIGSKNKFKRRALWQIYPVSIPGWLKMNREQTGRLCFPEFRDSVLI